MTEAEIDHWITKTVQADDDEERFQQTMKELEAEAIRLEKLKLEAGFGPDEVV